MTENIKNGSVLRVHPRNNNKKILFNFCFPSYNFPGTEEKLQELCPEDWGARQVQSGSAPQTQTEMRSPLEHLTEKVSTSSSLPTAAFPASLLSTAAIPGSVCAGMCRDVPGCAEQGREERLREGWERSTRRMPARKEGFPRCRDEREPQSRLSRGDGGSLPCFQQQS